METEDRDSDDAEKPNITFDPSLPTSHAVSDALTSGSRFVVCGRCKYADAL